MPTRPLCLRLKALFSLMPAASGALVLVALLMSAPPLQPQEQLPPAPAFQETPPPAPAVQAQPPPAPLPRTAQIPHKFWDKKNTWLFAGVAGTRALDYASTRNLRNRGLNEILLTNDIVDNKPLFAAIEVSGVALSIGVSYIFHSTGHHKLERWVSIVHISVGTGGSIRNYVLKPNQPAGVQ